MVPKKVKIVATLGPFSDSQEIVLKMAEAGVNVFRINLSHATHQEIQNRISWVRNAEKELKKPIAVMGDLAGPKIRIGEVEKDIVLEKDQIIKITTKEITGNKQEINLNHPSIIPQLKKGAEIFIDDGKIKFVVEEESDTTVKAKVLVGGVLHPRKGFNAQGISLATKGLSEKDKKDLNTVLELGVDALAISFVQTEKDIEIVRNLIPDDKKVVIIAKIETLRGTEEIEKIIKAADGIMVARGDLGLAVPMEEIPLLQKKIISMCLEKAKPVIIATQMLESMTTNPLPTRAEVTDVANAILDGTDAVMLSGETAAGHFPVETVQMMARIIRKITPHVHTLHFENEKNRTHAISSAAGIIAGELGTKLIVAFTESGKTAQNISRHRYPQVIFALTPNMTTWRKLNFTAGVYSFDIEPIHNIEEMIEKAKEIVVSNHIVKLEKGDPFIIVAGIPFGKSGSTNMLYVERA